MQILTKVLYPILVRALFRRQNLPSENQLELKCSKTRYSMAQYENDPHRMRELSRNTLLCSTWGTIETKKQDCFFYAIFFNHSNWWFPKLRKSISFRGVRKDRLIADQQHTGTAQ